jgi:Domain of unknown function (DUF6378)
MTKLEEFDAAIAKVTQQRGSVYGHPRENFRRIQALKAVVAECKNAMAREALEMICVKIARLIETPDHLDSWIDIAGYARTGVMAQEPIHDQEPVHETPISTLRRAGLIPPERPDAWR